MKKQIEDKQNNLVPLVETDKLVNEIAVDVRKNKIVFPIILGGLVVVVLIVLLTTILPTIKAAKKIGNALGTESGQIIGTAIGSVDGVTNGIKEGSESGSKEGRSAKDTTIEIANEIESNVKDLGELEILAANAELTTYHSVGNTYGALFLARANITFTIDLNDVSVTYKDNKISISIPEPTPHITIDPSEIDVIAEWQKKFFNGTDSQGYEAALNSYREIKEKSIEEIANYNELLKIASDSAKEQIRSIANATKGENSTVEIEISVR